MSSETILIVMCIVWGGIWIGSGIYYKKNKYSQPLGRGFLTGMFIAVLAILGLQFLFPSHEELLKKAESAEQQYFLLSAGSLNHEKICDAAYQTLKLYKRLGDEEKIKLFNYIVITDKCL